MDIERRKFLKGLATVSIGGLVLGTVGIDKVASLMPEDKPPTVVDKEIEALDAADNLTIEDMLPRIVADKRYIPHSEILSLDMVREIACDTIFHYGDRFEHHKSPGEVWSATICISNPETLSLGLTNIKIAFGDIVAVDEPAYVTSIIEHTKGKTFYHIESKVKYDHEHWLLDAKP